MCCPDVLSHWLMPQHSHALPPRKEETHRAWKGDLWGYKSGLGFKFKYQLKNTHYFCNLTQDQMPLLKFWEVFIGTRATPIARTHWGHWQYKQTSEKGIHTAVTLATHSFPPTKHICLKSWWLQRRITPYQEHHGCFKQLQTLWEEVDLWFGMEAVVPWAPISQGHHSQFVCCMLRSSHCAVTIPQCVWHWEGTGPAGLMEMRGWEPPSLQWDLPPARSAHPNSAKTSLCHCSCTTSTLQGRCGGCFCLTPTIFPVKPPLQEHAWGRHVYFRHTAKWNLCWYKGGQPWSSWTTEANPANCHYRAVAALWWCDSVAVPLHWGQAQSMLTLSWLCPGLGDF